MGEKNSNTSAFCGEFVVAKNTNAAAARSFRVGSIAKKTRLVGCEPRGLALLRRLLAPLLRPGLPTAKILAIITGTDHPLGEFAPSGKTQVELALMQRP